MLQGQENVSSVDPVQSGSGELGLTVPFIQNGLGDAPGCGPAAVGRACPAEEHSLEHPAAQQTHGGHQRSPYGHTQAVEPAELFDHVHHI